MSACDDGQSSMLILSRAIYARRSDDAFYPGTVQTKQPDGSYLVKFREGTSERVVENDITWLGFWGLPPWMWPQNPIIQTAGPANMDFLNGLLGNDNRKEHVSVSVPFKTLLCEGSESSKRVNGFSELQTKSDHPTHSEKMSNEYVEELNAFDERTAHIQPKQSSESQARTSVLRMCCTDENLEREHSRAQKDFGSIEHKLDSPVFKHSTHSTSRSDDRHFNFEEACKTLKVKNHTPLRKRKMFVSEYEEEEDSIKEKYMRSKDVASRLPNSSSAQKQYPTSMPPLLCPYYQNYDPSFGVSMYNAPSPPSPASFRLHRTRRRSENKKCRKVYGIENRDIWCTQCKWKKACTRFTNNDKGDRPGLTYITDHESLQYPV